MFITGGTPLALDDAVGAFNIGTHISLAPEFNALLGFTEAEVRALVQTCRKAGALSLDEDVALDAMRERHGGYRFAERAEETVYNTNMVLRFLAAAMPNKPLPDDLIDESVRTDYSQLRHLLTLLADSQNGVATGTPDGAPSPSEDAGAAWRPKGNLELLRRVAEDGQVNADIQRSFTLERLRGENFLSLLYHLGLLTIREGDAGWTCLHIPNQMARQLLQGLLSSEDAGRGQPGDGTDHA